MLQKTPYLLNEEQRDIVGKTIESLGDWTAWSRIQFARCPHGERYRPCEWYDPAATRWCAMGRLYWNAHRAGMSLTAAELFGKEIADRFSVAFHDNITTVNDGPKGRKAVITRLTELRDMVVV